MDLNLHQVNSEFLEGKGEKEGDELDSFPLLSL